MLTNEFNQVISLDGSWEFCLGEGPWSSIQVPGAWEAQGYSKFIDGPARYRRRMFIPPDWQGKKIFLEFQAVSYACQVYLNGLLVGEHRGIWTPFLVDISEQVQHGKQNTLEISLFKPGTRYPMRSSLAGFIPDVATTFGGLWQPVYLLAFSSAIEDHLVLADYQAGCVHVRCTGWMFAGSLTNLPKKMDWVVETWLEGKNVASQSLAANFTQNEKGDFISHLDTSLAIPAIQYWSMDHPNLYDVRVQLRGNEVPLAAFSRRTGFRQLSKDNDQLLLNGKPFMVRGILSWGWEADRIAPFYPRELAREEFRRVREMGFNLIKLCLFVPNTAYFDAADEEGILLWEEMPMWLPDVTDELREQAPKEYEAITQHLQHHPSLILYSLGCELNQSVDIELLQTLDRSVRTQLSLAGQTADVLICDNSGSGESYGGLDFDLADFSDYHPYYDLHFFEPLLDNWRRDWQSPRPWIFGEFCDSDTFRDPQSIINGHGGEIPWWLTRNNPVTTWRSEARAMLEASSRLAQANLPFTSSEIQQVSYAQSLVIRKYTLEALRRRAGIGGYIVTGLRDTPISTSGIWDDFYRSKWNPDEFHFNADTVLLLDVGRRRQWRFGGDRPDRLDMHNYRSGSQASWHILIHTTAGTIPAGSLVRWKIQHSTGQTLANGLFYSSHAVPPGKPAQLGKIRWDMPQISLPEEYKLIVDLDFNGQIIQNHWPIWNYPALQSFAGKLAIYDVNRILDPYGDWFIEIPHVSANEIHQSPALLTLHWDENVRRYIHAGGHALLLQQNAGPLPAQHCPFWREAIKLFYNHPIWRHFSHQGFTDLQFFGIAADTSLDTGQLMNSVRGIDSLQPILRRLDAREFLVSDYILEVRIGRGRMIACTLPLQGGAGYQPFGWQRNVAGAALLQAMLMDLVKENYEPGIKGDQ
jgi:hypothetical protein